MKFINCKINVSKKVFEPRIETEFWVEKEISKIKNNNKKLYFLDVFSGTGCVGIAILKNIKNSRVDFTDISTEALKQIRINLKLNKITPERYEIIKSDVFKRIKSGKYDFIFANPPYVAENRIKEVQKEVLEKDPWLALFAGKEGLDAIKKFLSQAKIYLNPKGRIFMEFDPFQKKEIEKILKRLKLKFIFKKDQFNKIRWLEAEI